MVVAFSSSGRLRSPSEKQSSLKWTEHTLVESFMLKEVPLSLQILTIHFFLRSWSRGKEWKETGLPMTPALLFWVQPGTQQYWGIFFGKFTQVWLQETDLTANVGDCNFYVTAIQ